mmetsp:Transcript_14875/g.46161  ORF Transcript_14875/g.46161 Transcript_14875/m.46161 type:complete len:135 (+) Transcript_14875:159-563(+)
MTAVAGGVVRGETVGTRLVVNIGATFEKQARHVDVDAARLLIDRGAGVDRVQQYGHTALFIACFKGHTDVVRLCLGRGASVDLAARDGMTPLIVAALNGRVCAARLCLQHGAARFNRTTDLRCTVLARVATWPS